MRYHGLVLLRGIIDMINVIKKSFFLILIQICLVIVVPSKISFAESNTPQDIVRKYYTKDLQGVRLSGDTYGEIESLITWKHEPGWDHAFIVNEISIRDSKEISKDDTLIEVKYHIIGIMDGHDLLEFIFYEVIDFEVTRDQGEWKIKNPIFPPHISVKSAIKHFEELSSKITDEDRKTINRTIERLRELQVN